MWKLGQDKEVRCTLISMGTRGPIPKATTIDILLLLICSNLNPNQSAESMLSHDRENTVYDHTTSLIRLDLYIYIYLYIL